MLVKELCKKWLLYRGEKINRSNRVRLKNTDLTLICSNCAGGILYHWLGIRFNSPFINLFMEPQDFVCCLENWEKFISTGIVEDTNTEKKYPVGIGYKNVRIHFMHYKTFSDAVTKWDERKSRINMDNAAIFLSNYFDIGGGGQDILERFDDLPFHNKVVFVEEKHPDIECAVYLRGYRLFRAVAKRCGLVPNIWMVRNIITGTRYIDQFDYVGFFNHVKPNSKRVS